MQHILSVINFEISNFDLSTLSTAFKIMERIAYIGLTANEVQILVETKYSSKWMRKPHYLGFAGYQQGQYRPYTGQFVPSRHLRSFTSHKISLSQRIYYFWPAEDPNKVYCTIPSSVDFIWQLHWPNLSRLKLWKWQCKISETS